MYICICNRITDRQICRAVDQGAASLTEVQRQLPVARCCGRCAASACALIHQQQQSKRNASFVTAGAAA
jgi:bacterioferritin-associated ferredoxin